MLPSISLAGDAEGDGWLDIPMQDILSESH